MKTKTIQIDAGHQQSFGAYVAVPDFPNGRAIVVAQEIFGITPYIKDVAERYARDGYLAIAPDLFWRVEGGLSLTHSKVDMQRALAILAGFSEDLGIQDIEQAVVWAKAQQGISGVALVGMCLGGKLAWLAAARLPIAASISFYGVGIEKDLDEANKLKVPLLMFFGGKDKYAPAPVRDQINAAVAGKKNVSMRVYEDADHGFYTRGEAADIKSAHAEALDFLNQHMQAGGTKT